MKKIIGFGIAALTALSLATPQAHAFTNPNTQDANTRAVTGDSTITLNMGNFVRIESGSDFTFCAHLLRPCATAALGFLAAFWGASQAHAFTNPNAQASGTRAVSGSSAVGLNMGNFCRIESLNDVLITPTQASYNFPPAGRASTPVLGNNLSVTVNTNSGTGAILKISGESGAISDDKIRPSDVRLSATALSTLGFLSGRSGTIASGYRLVNLPPQEKALTTTPDVLWSINRSTSTFQSLGNVDISVNVSILNLRLYPGGSASGGATRTYTNHLTLTLGPNS